MNVEIHHEQEKHLPGRKEAAFPAQETEEERFLRPFAVDAGVAALRPGSTAEEPDLLSLVVAARPPGNHEWLRPERETILTHAQHARTIAELAAAVGLPLGQVRAMTADMLDEGSLQRREPSRHMTRADLLHSVLVGLHAL